MNDIPQLDLQDDLFDGTDWQPIAKEGFDCVQATAYMKKYWDGYDTQDWYENYELETFLEDALYGLGVAIDPIKYRYANGLERFKRFLQKRWFKRDLEGRYL